jgi:hypothetical protein
MAMAMAMAMRRQRAPWQKEDEAQDMHGRIGMCSDSRSSYMVAGCCQKPAMEGWKKMKKEQQQQKKKKMMMMMMMMM